MSSTFPKCSLNVYLMQLVDYYILNYYLFETFPRELLVVLISFQKIIYCMFILNPAFVIARIKDSICMKTVLLIVVINKFYDHQESFFSVG